MRDHTIHPKIPYPFVVLTTAFKEHDYFTIVDSEDQLPKFFRKKSARTTKIDQNLLVKKDFHLKRLRCIEIGEKLSNLKRKGNLMRKLANLSHEHLFLSTLKDRIKNGAK